MLIQSAKVGAIAVVSRLVILLLSAVSDALLSDYDTSSTLNSRPCDIDGPPAAQRMSAFGKHVWDSVYFTRIAKCGYEYEQYHAFFPGLPHASAAIARILDVDADCYAIPLLITSLTFSLSVVIFHRFSSTVLGDERKALLASCLLCISPASVFLAHGYTESLFQLATFAGIYLLVHWQSPALAAISFSASCYVRSNGMINGGFLLYDSIQCISHSLRGVQKWSRCLSRCLLSLTGLFGMAYTISFVLQKGYDTYCHSVQWQDHVVVRPFCAANGPTLYSFIQSQYWGVGFLRYYQWKQIPNFLLAAPIAVISASAVLSYCAHDIRRVLTLGNLAPMLQRSQQRGEAYSRAKEAGFYRSQVFVFVAHLGAMLAFALVFMHVQVTTRFLACCPALYWYMAEVLQRDRLVGRLILLYCLVWAWVGMVLFPNFYPWT